MEKRTLILGEYNTAAHGLWTLNSWTLEEPELLTNMQPVPGRIKGPLDLSTALTDGRPSYGPVLFRPRWRAQRATAWRVSAASPTWSTVCTGSGSTS